MRDFTKVAPLMLMLAMLAMGMVALAACGSTTDTGALATSTPAAEATSTIATVATDTPAMSSQPSDTATTDTSAAAGETPTGDVNAMSSDTATPDAATTGSDTTPTTAAQASGSTTVNAVLKEWSITLSQQQVPAGKITFNVTNEGMMAHNLTVEGDSGVLGKTSNFDSSQGAQTLEVTLSPGTYTLICSLPGHAARGQKTTLVVK